MMRRILRPRIIIPIILSMGVLAALLAIGNVRRIFAEVTTFRLADVVWFVALFLLYELLKGVQWATLLRTLDARLRGHSIALSFVTGEVTKYLPLGNYFPNYLLRETDRLDFGLTSAATTTVVLFEVVISLIGVAILGLGGWSSWLRPLVIIGSALTILLVAVVYRFRAKIVTPSWMRRHRLLRTALVELHRFGIGLRRLAHPRTLLLGALLCAAYLAAASGTLLVILQGLGVSSLSYGVVAGVYTFTLAFALIEPSPVDLGILELGGVGALLAVGVDPTTAVTAMLISRVLSVAVGVAIATIGVAVLHRTLREALRGTEAAEIREHIAP